MKNSSFNTADVKKVCENKVDIKFREGKEFNGWYFLNGRKTCRITVSKGKKPIPMGTYKSMSRQLKLTVEQFDKFLECSLTTEQYEQIVKGQGI